MKKKYTGHFYRFTENKLWHGVDPWGHNFSYESIADPTKEIEPILLLGYVS